MSGDEPAPFDGGLKGRATATTLYLIFDAIDLLMAEAGEQSVERWETRRKK